MKEISDQNEKKVSKDSLNAELIHWKDGEKILCKKWIKNLLVELSHTSKTLKISNYLKPIYDVLAEGNQSMQWIDKYKQGLSVEEIMVSAIKNMHQNEQQNNLWL